MGSLIAGVLATSFLMGGSPAPAAEPKRVPVPTFTPTPGGIHGDYAELATKYQQALAQAMTQVGQLLAAPQLADAGWQAQVTAAMSEVETAYAQLLRLEPNEKWAPFHREMTTGAADCNAAMRVLDLALDEEDRSAVSVVGALLNRCQSHLTAAEELVGTTQAQ
ncbi:MAG: hypothetical protein IT328_12065 [Caldilineaceae bacterium]|nr:hypothetical protein [Caldilineaceae bacterium]